MNRREAEREARQAFILEAARTLFEKDGIEQTSMDQIAVAAEYTRRTLYSYFQSRDEILLRIHQQYLEHRWRRQKTAISTASQPIDQIRAWSAALIECWMENPLSMRFEQYWDAHAIDAKSVGPNGFQRFKALNEEMANRLTDLFQAGIDTGQIRPDLELNACVSQFLVSLRAVAYRAFAQGYTFAAFEPGAYFQGYVDLFVRGIRTPE